MESKQQELLNEAYILLINHENLKYFGVLSLWLEKEFYKIQKDFEKKDVTDKDNLYAFVHGKTIKFYYNENTNIGDYVYGILFSVLYMINNHMFRLGKKEKHIWSVACTHMNNCIIEEIRKKMNILKNKDLFILEEFGTFYKDVTTDEVYDSLLKKIDLENIKILSDEFFIYENRLFSIVDEEENPEFQDICKSVWVTPSLRGTSPGNISIFLDKLFKYKMPWEDILVDSIKYVSHNTDKRTWSKPNKLFRRPKYKMRGIKDEGKLGLKDLYICADSSLSISDEDLKLFCGITNDCSKHFKNIKLIVHDTSISNIVVIKNMKKNRNIEDVLKSSIKGRGGTSHLKVFQFIEKEKLNNKISTVIFLTDFESDVLSIKSNFNFLNEYYNIWILNKKYPVEAEEIGKFSRIIVIDQKKIIK